MLGSANMGGFFAPEMAWAGFHHLVITGKAKNPSYIYIHNGEIEIRDAGDIWGQSVTDAQWAIRQELGDEEVKSCVCGPAGENLVRFANVMTGVKNAAGRTGMGCVMGSKNLKAVSARGTMDLEIAHPMEALEYNKNSSSKSPAPKSVKPRERWERRLSGVRPIPGEGSEPAIFNTTSVNIPMISNPSASMRFVKRPWDRTI